MTMTYDTFYPHYSSAFKKQLTTVEEWTVPFDCFGILMTVIVSIPPKYNEPLFEFFLPNFLIDFDNYTSILLSDYFYFRLGSVAKFKNKIQGL